MITVLNSTKRKDALVDPTVIFLEIIRTCY